VTRFLSKFFMINTVRISLHVLTNRVSSGPLAQLRGSLLPTLIAPADLARDSFVVSSESVFAELDRWPRCYVEPDGSFVWRSPEGEQPAWQWDGHLHDQNDKLLQIDLHGSGPQESFEQLLRLLDWPTTEVLVQLTEEGVFIDLASFYRYARIL
jgi:hypothetical protein